MSAHRFYPALLLTVIWLAGCSRPAPVPVRDAPPDRIMIVQESTRKDGLKQGEDVVSVTVHDGVGNRRTERFFVRGQALVYVFNAASARTAADARDPAARTPPPPPGEFSTEATLRTIHEFVTASRSRWFTYRGKVSQSGESFGESGGARGRGNPIFDFYEGTSADGAAQTNRMRMYVNRANGLLEYQNCERDGAVDIKAITYFGHRPLPAGLFEPNDTRVRAFEFLDHKVILRYENLQIYEETVLRRVR